MTESERELWHIQTQNEEQQVEIDALKQQVTSLEDRILVLESRIAKAAEAFAAEY